MWQLDLGKMHIEYHKIVEKIIVNMHWINIMGHPLDSQLFNQSRTKFATHLVNSNDQYYDVSIQDNSIQVSFSQA